MGLAHIDGTLDLYVIVGRGNTYDLVVYLPMQVLDAAWSVEGLLADVAGYPLLHLADFLHIV